MKKVPVYVPLFLIFFWDVSEAEKVMVLKVEPRISMSVVFPEECWEVTKVKVDPPIQPSMGKPWLVPQSRSTVATGQKQCMRVQSFVDHPDGYWLTIQRREPSGKIVQHRIHSYYLVIPGQQIVIDEEKTE